MVKEKGSLRGIATGALVGLFLFALVLTASAQDKPVTISKDRAETVKLTVSGAINMDWVWRDEMMNIGRTSGYSSGLTSGGTDGPGEDPVENTGTVEGAVKICLDATLSDNVSANVTLGNYRVQHGYAAENTGTFGRNPETNSVYITDVSVTFAEVLNPGVTVKAGTQNYAFDVRGRGSAFFFDPRNSGTFTSNLYQGITGVPGLNVGGAQVDSTDPDTLQPTGLTVTYVADKMTLDFLVWPATIEGGQGVNQARVQDDEANYAVDLWYTLDQVGNGSKIGVLMLTTTFPGRKSQITTVGGGVDLKGMAEGLELYGEIYLQFGDAGEADVDGDGLLDTLKAKGSALQIGGQYNVQSENKIWIGGNLTWVTGDIDLDKNVKIFATYENVNDLLVIEDAVFGLDVDTNYRAIKISGGCVFSAGGVKDNVELTGIFGIVNTAKDVQLPSSPMQREDKLGNELDVKVKYLYSKAASVSAQLGYLFGADLLEDAGIYAGMNDPDNSAMIVTVGTEVKF